MNTIDAMYFCTDNLLFNLLKIYRMNAKFTQGRSNHFILTIVIITGLIFANLTNLSAQNEIAGKVTDEKGEALFPASVILIDSNGNSLNIGSQTDFDGNYSIKPLDIGKYNLRVTSLGYITTVIKGIRVNSDRLTIQNITLEKANIITKEVMITNKTIDDIKSMPTRNLTDIAAKVVNVYQADASRKIVLGRARESGTVYYVNGVKTLGEPNDIDNFPTINHSHTDRSQYGFTSTAAVPLSTFSIDVDKAAYSIIRKSLNENSKPNSDIVRIEEMINYFDYHYLPPKDTLPFAVHTEMTACLWNSNHHLLKIGIQSVKSDTTVKPANLVFLVDVSGSMGTPDKLPLVKKTLQLLLKQLGKNDKIAIVTYAGSAGLALPSTPATDVSKINAAIDRMESGGSTAGGAGIELAYTIAKENFIKGGINRVILCTDGDFNVGYTIGNGLEGFIAEKRKSDIFLSVFGFGDHYSDQTMELLADKGNGNYAFIDGIAEAEKIVNTQLRGTINTIAKDVKIQLVFNPNIVRTYKLIGYENRRLKNEEFENDTIDAGEIGENTSVTALYEVVLNDDFREAEVLLTDNKTKVLIGENQAAAIQIRYKEPAASQSRLISSIAAVENIPIENAGKDTKLAVATAAFGMKLNKEKACEKLSFDTIKKLLQTTLTPSGEKDKEELMQLIAKASAMY